MIIFQKQHIGLSEFVLSYFVLFYCKMVGLTNLRPDIPVCIVNVMFSIKKVTTVLITNIFLKLINSYVICVV